MVPLYLTDHLTFHGALTGAARREEIDKGDLE